MANDQRQSSRKLVYLKDHPARNHGRRLERREPAVPGPRSELEAESTWLGRSIVGVAGLLLLYWLGALGGPSETTGAAPWRWLLFQGLPHLALAGGALFTARATLSHKTYAPLALALMAGGLVVLSIEGLTHGRLMDELPNLSPRTRIEIFVRVTTLLIGVWATSFAFRIEKQRRRESQDD